MPLQHVPRDSVSFWEARGHSGDFRDAYLVGGAFSSFLKRQQLAAARCSVPGMKEGRVCNDGTRHQLAFSQTKAVTAAGGGAHVVLLVVPHELERNGTERKQPWCVGGVCFQGTTKAKGRVLHAVLATCTP